jgi:hypothetical protein
VSTATNPWGCNYKLAAGKRNKSTQITTLRKPYGSPTANTKETLSLMMDTFAPKDNRRDDNYYHKQVMALTKQPANTADDQEFTIDEISNIIQRMNNNKVPGEDGITGVIYNHAFKTVPTFITAIYNGCLKQGIFPAEWKKARLIPIIKPETENSCEVSKYRPNSLLSIGSKVLEKLMINRINHHVFTTEYINKNQYGFMPQTSTFNAVMALKDYIEEGFRSGEVAVAVNLDVEGVFNSAWWPIIQKILTTADAPGTHKT